jgi:hypothetical protein
VQRSATSSGRGRLAALVAAGVIVLTAAGVGPAAALAAAEEPTPAVDDVGGLPAWAVLTAEPAPGRLTLGAPMPGNPNGCAGETDPPARSNGQASVRGRTTCAYAAQQLSVGTTLYRSDWWGLNVMDTASSARPVGTTSGDAVASASCGRAPSRTYVGVSSHRVTVSGVRYSSTTSSSSMFACRG